MFELALNFPWKKGAVREWETEEASNHGRRHPIEVNRKHEIKVKSQIATCARAMLSL